MHKVISDTTTNTNTPITKTPAFIEGYFIKDDVKIEVVGDDAKSKYRYRWMSTVDATDGTKVHKNTDSIFVLMIDLSWSMYESKSAQPACDATVEVCKHLFTSGIKNVAIIFFGKTAHFCAVDPTNYIHSIKHATDGYFDALHDPKGVNFEKRNIFDPSGTCPESAFHILANNIKTVQNKNIQILMMTDGKFTGIKQGNYDLIWDAAFDKLLDTKNTFNIHCIGYQNDDINNIKEMKKAADNYMLGFVYTTIKLTDEITAAMTSAINLLMSEAVPFIRLKDQVLKQYDSTYSTLRYFEDLHHLDVCKSSAQSGVSEEWVKDVLLFEIDVGIKEIEITDIVALSGSGGSGDGKKQTDDAYENIIKELVPYYTQLQTKYIALKSAYKSLKSRHIPVWKSLQDKIAEFTKLYSNIQSLIAERLNAKKAFELSTHISKHISGRHLKTLQRRRIHNEQQKKEYVFNITIQSKDPTDQVFMSFTTDIKDDKKYECGMDSTQETLDAYYECLFSKDNWTESLNSLFGVPIHYAWKEADDWAPSKAYIGLVSASNFISLQGYHEMQEIFGGHNNEDHTQLYKNTSYIKSAHDETNAIIPIATDPFFQRKIHLIKERLGHTIAGSSLGFANRHIMFYCAVLKQCFNQFLENKTEKMEHIIVLLLNTFRILTDKLNCIFDKNQHPLPRSDIIVNIALGNTAPHLFSGQFDPVLLCMTASEREFEVAHKMYTGEFAATMTLDEFKQLTWCMLYRHLLITSIASSSAHEQWTDPKLWKLLDNKSLEQKLQQEGAESIEKYMMNEKRLDTVPDEIKEDVAKITTNKITNLFLLLVQFNDTFNDKVWYDFNRSFLPYKHTPIAQAPLTKYFQDINILNEIALETVWALICFGSKDCYPHKQFTDCKKIIITKINDKYSQNLKTSLADVKELLEFRKRHHETRYLPVTFTNEQASQVNSLFVSAYEDKVHEDEFRKHIYVILGDRIKTQIKEALTEGIDVLANLYNYCKKHKNTLCIKINSRLPHSMPSNATSPLFLQPMTDNEFSAYFRPLGLGWAAKTHRKWVDDLHPFMMSKLWELNLMQFVQAVVEHAEMYKISSDEDLKLYAEEATHFYTTYKDPIYKSQQKFAESGKHYSEE